MSKGKSPATAAAVFLLLLLSIACLHSPTEAVLVHNDFYRHQLRKRHSSGKIPLPPPEPLFVANYNWVQEQLVEAHNELRATVGSPPLKWDSTLTRYAHAYAVKRKDDCDYRTHSGGPYGENLFWQKYKESSPDDVVKTWFEEQRFFDHRSNTCKCHPQTEGCECGHYTNVIWATTEKVGCSGYVYCNDQKGVLVVCSYYPKGNEDGKNPLSRS